MKRFAIMTTAGMLMTGCASVAGSETDRTICRELRRELPSYSRHDTQRTKEEADRFFAVFEAICGD